MKPQETSDPGSAIGRSFLLKQIASVELWEIYYNMTCVLFRTGRYEINVYIILYVYTYIYMLYV